MKRESPTKVLFICENCEKKMLVWRRWAITNYKPRRFCSHKCSVAGTKKYNLPIGKTLGHHGYIRVYLGREGGRTRYAYEHRYVMEKFLGRKLKKEEVVHHISGDTSDNRIENLELVKNNGEHRTKHHSRAKRDERGRFCKQWTCRLE